MSRGPRLNSGNAPVRAVVSSLEESAELDRLECGHWTRRVYREGRHVTRRRCASCPPVALGAHVERKRSESRPR